MNIPRDFSPDLQLVDSIDRMKADGTPAGKLRFFKELKAAHFLVPCQGGVRNIVVMNTSQGEAFLPAFTCAEELARGSFPGRDAIVLTLDTLHHIVIDQPKLTGVAVNPLGKALLLRRPQLSEIDSHTEGMTLQRTDHEKPQILMPLKNYPIGLPVVLKTLFQSHPEVYRAWLVSAQRDLKEPPHKLIVIDFDGDRKSLFPLIAKTVQPFMCPGESFELMKADYGLLQAVSHKTQPIYIKADTSYSAGDGRHMKREP